MGQKLVNVDSSLPLRDRHEKFCQIYAMGDVSASEAFRQAGYAPKHADANASRLIAKDGIKDRLAYLRAERAVKDGITRQGQTRKLAIIQERCLAAGEHSTYVRAVEATNRMYGLDKQIIEQHIDQPMSRSEQQEADDWAEFRLWKASRAGPGHVVGIRAPA